MAELHLTNSLTRRKERFAPLDPGHVRVYVCGPTVYDLAHIGNARTFVAFDVLVRLLRHLFPRVTYVRNITDVDDKINARAAASGEPIAAITARTTADFHADMAALGVAPPDVEPRATGHVAEMVAMIARLIEAGHAYAAQGHVLFAVASFAEYGKLSGRSPDELLAGARVEVAPYKRDAGDFVLWKPSGADEPGWDSPWGRGRPGWHIECSAMAWRYLGETFDIHGGGRDLIFPHHENECAQSLCAFPGSGFARYWLHSGMLVIDQQKMSKSLGNFFTIRDVLERVGPGRTEDVRLALMRAHYRAELEFSDRTLDEAGRELDRFYRALAYNVGVPPGMPSEKFLACLCDDLNTPAAIAELHRLTDESLAGDGPSTSQLRASGQLLGLLGHDPEVRFQMGGDRAWIEQLIEERKAARRNKDYATAAVIRDKLAKEHIILEDAGDGSTTWRLARNYHGALRAAAGTSVTASAYIVSKQSNANKPTE